MGALVDLVLDIIFSVLTLSSHFLSLGMKVCQCDWVNEKKKEINVVDLLECPLLDSVLKHDFGTSVPATARLCTHAATNLTSAQKKVKS